MSNKEEKLNRWLRSEVAAAFAVGSAVAGMIVYFTNPVQMLRTDMAVMQIQVDNIKNNDLTHIFREQTASATRLESLEKQSIADGKTLTEILVLLREKK